MDWWTQQIRYLPLLSLHPKRIDDFKLWCWRRLKSPLDSREIKPVNPKGNQLWIFIGWPFITLSHYLIKNKSLSDAKAECPILWSPDVRSQLIGKDLDAGKDWRQEEKGTPEDEMAGWHHQLDGHEFEQAPGVGEVQGSLACCSPWGHKEPDRTSNWTELDRTARRSSQSILKEINLEYSLEGLMLKLKLYYFGRLMWRDNSLKKILILGKLEGRKRGQQSWMASLTQWTWVWANSWRQWRTGKPGVLQFVGSQGVRHNN